MPCWRMRVLLVELRAGLVEPERMLRLRFAVVVVAVEKDLVELARDAEPEERVGAAVVGAERIAELGGTWLAPLEPWSSVRREPVAVVAAAYAAGEPASSVAVAPAAAADAPVTPCHQDRFAIEASCVVVELVQVGRPSTLSGLKRSVGLGGW